MANYKGKGSKKRGEHGQFIRHFTDTDVRRWLIVLAWFLSGYLLGSVLTYLLIK